MVAAPAAQCVADMYVRAVLMALPHAAAAFATMGAAACDRAAAGLAPARLAQVALAGAKVEPRANSEYAVHIFAIVEESGHVSVFSAHNARASQICAATSPELRC